MRAAVALVAFGAFACRPTARPGALPIGQILLDDGNLSARPELGSTREEVRREVAQLIESTGRFVVREGGKGTVELEIGTAQRIVVPAPTVGPGQLAGDREMAAVAVTLTLQTPGAHGEPDRLIAEGEARRPTNADVTMDPAARRLAFDAALESAVREAALALKEQLDARGRTDAQLIGDLASPEARTRDYAIRVLADRRSAAAVPALIERLNDENLEVARRAAGALIAIGDRRAVAPLIELARRRRADDAAPLLYAIGSLGGPEAEAFLFTLESGAIDAQVRRAASAAYHDLLARKAEDAARVSDDRKAP